MKKQVTYKKIIAFINFANYYLATKPEETKLTAAIRNVLKQCIRYELAENYNERVADLRVDFALVDEKTKALIHGKEPGTYAMDAEGTKGFNKAIKALLNETVEIHPRISTENDELALAGDFMLADYSIMAGIVLTESEENEEAFTKPTTDGAGENPNN